MKEISAPLRSCRLVESGRLSFVASSSLKKSIMYSISNLGKKERGSHCTVAVEKARSRKLFFFTEGDHVDRFLLSLCYVGCGGGNFSRVLSGGLPSRKAFFSYKKHFLPTDLVDKPEPTPKNHTGVDEDIGRARTNKKSTPISIYSFRWHG